MQTFKQYLKESTSDNFNLSLLVGIKNRPGNIDLEKKTWIKFNDCKITDLETSENDISITLEFENTIFNKKRIEEIISELVKFIEIEYKVISIQSTLLLYTMPNHPVEWDTVELNNFETPTESLHNVDKLIKCNKFIIDWTNRISDSVLGLLKMNAEISFNHKWNSSVTGDSTEAWTKIIKKYLNGTKDVWKCQDELQDADLDDYAQL